MAKITIFGLAGTGKSTVGKLLAEKLDYTFLSTGTLFRKKAESIGLDVHTYGELCNTDSAHDKAFDDDIRLYGETHDNFVIDSRLAWYFIPDSFKIKLICKEDERILRVAVREDLSFKEAKDKHALREQHNVTRYREFYSIEDYGDDHYFDLVIDTTTVPSAGVVAQIEGYLKER